MAFGLGGKARAPKDAKANHLMGIIHRDVLRAGRREWRLAWPYCCGDYSPESRGRRCAQGQARSNAVAMRSRAASAPTGAMSWIASGMPALSKPAGRLTAGLPVRL